MEEGVWHELVQHDSKIELDRHNEFIDGSRDSRWRPTYRSFVYRFCALTTPFTPSRRRYSAQGDTVILFGAEHNAGVDVALSRGRKVEAFVTSAESAAKVEEQAKAAFKASYSKGIFQVCTRFTTGLCSGVREG